MVTTSLVTAEELEAMPEEERRQVLFRGVLYRMSPTSGHHGRGLTRTARFVDTFVDEHALGIVYSGDTGFVLARDPDVVLAPDIAFVRADRLPPEAEQERFLRLAPDLAVEIVSPSDTGPSVEDKVAAYFEAGVRMVWLMEPRRRTVRVRKPDGTDRLLSEDDELDGDDVLPGFRIRVRKLFG